MLIRCVKCGKPVFCAPGAARAECGYCYALNGNTGGASAGLRPSGVDWAQPLLYYAGSEPLRAMDPDWAAFLKDEPAFQRLLEEKKMQEDAEDRRKLASVSLRMENAVTPAEIDFLIPRVRPLTRLNEAKELLEALENKKRLLIARERAKEEKERKKKRLLHLLTALSVLAVCLGIAAYILISIHVLQPRRLDEALAKAAAGNYAAAEDVCAEMAGRKGWTVNAETARRAAQELPLIRSSWGDSLAAAGQWREAAEKYALAGEEEKAASALRSFALELEEENRPEEAAAVWQRIGGDEAGARIAALYAALYRQRLEEADYEGALAFLEKAGFGGEETEKEKQTLYLRWGNALAEAGDMGAAADKWRLAGDRPDILTAIRDKKRSLIRDEALPVIVMWKAESDEAARDILIEKLISQGSALSAADEILYFFQLLDDAGISLNRVFPNGAAVTDVSACGISTDAPGQADLSRPLVFFRRERDYKLSQFDLLLPPTSHNELSESSYTLRLLSSAWQALPKDRRPSSMSECTCILLADCVYITAGQIPARFRIPVSTGGGFIPAVTVFPSLSDSKGLLNRYTARARLLLWRWPAMEAELISQKDRAAQLSPILPAGRQLEVDWSVTRNGTNYRDLGLAGEFDIQWLNEQLNSAFREILEGEEAPVWNR